MGSPLRLTVAGAGPSNDSPVAETAWAETLEEFAAADATMSRFAETSELTLLNRSAGSGQTVAVGRRLERALVAADRARRITAGRFDPRVLDALEAIGERGADLGAEAVGQRVGSGARDGWLDTPILCRRSRGSVTIDRPIDLGGIGKGLALRWAADRIAAAGCGDFLLDAGGDLVIHGTAPGGGPWQVGIEDPEGGAIPRVVLTPPDGAVVTSSIRLRSWSIEGREVHHLIDPRTGEPADASLRAVTVVARDPAWAEVWSKALFVAGEGTISREARALGLAAWWVTAAGALEMTPAARAMTIWVAGEPAAEGSGVTIGDDAGEMVALRTR